MKEKKIRIRKDAYDYQWSVPAAEAAVLALLLYVSMLRRTARMTQKCGPHCPCNLILKR